MAVIVEHEKRRHEILSQALDLFAEEGYANVTFQKIADRCGITRTTLYLYFKNKREIFSWSIRQSLSGVESDLRAAMADKSLGAAECLRRMVLTILDACERNSQIFKVLLVYFLETQGTPPSPAERIERRTMRLRHLFSTVVIRGQKAGELKALPVKEVNALLQSLIENAAFHIVVLGQANLDSSRAILSSAIDTLKP